MPKKGSKPKQAVKKVAKKTAPKKRQATKATKKINQPAQKILQAYIKNQRRGAKKKLPKQKMLEAMFDKYFFDLSHKQVTQLMKEWNETNLNIQLEDQKNYDQWLNYFKKIPVSHIRILLTTGEDILGAEGYAALTRWVDIISNPGRIDKIHKAGLTGGGEGKQSITELAETNDRYGVLKAIRNQLASRLQNNPGNRDTADLSKQLTEIMTQIADYERRLAPNKKTVLGDLLSDMPSSSIKSKRPAKNGGGARQTSFSSRVTIKDLEEN